MRSLVGPSVLLAILLHAIPAAACKCASPPPEINTPRKLTSYYAKGTPVIFEGRVIARELDIPLVKAQPGEWIRADQEDLRLTVRYTFALDRSYRGKRLKEVNLWTGLGAGDCGFDFEIGERYLVFAEKDDDGRLATSICSGTGHVRDRLAMLAQLRHEPTPPVASDDREVDSGKVCGRVDSPSIELTDEPALMLFRSDREWLIPHETAALSEDGSFCIEHVDPGSYYLVFVDRDENPTGFSIFPGVTEPAKAQPISVGEGETISGLTLIVNAQPLYSVSGRITVSGASPPPGMQVVLGMQSNGAMFLPGYVQNVSVDGTFHFAAVLPGQYQAAIMLEDVPEGSPVTWWSRKVNVDVSGSTVDVLLELAARRQ